MVALVDPGLLKPDYLSFATMPFQFACHSPKSLTTLEYREPVATAVGPENITRPGGSGMAEEELAMARRNLLALAMVGAVSLFCWQATQGAKPKDEMLELYGLFVDAVEQVEANYVRPVSRRELLESALEGDAPEPRPALLVHQHERVEAVPQADRRQVRRHRHPGRGRPGDRHG